MKKFFNRFFALLRWEWQSYTSQPLYWFFAAVFLALCNALVFQVGRWIDNDQADLMLFFNYTPWLLVILIPALTMLSWSEDIRSQRVEILRTLPINDFIQVAAKSRAGATFVALIIGTTLPIWLTVSYLGDPDHGLIFSGFIGLLILSIVYLAIGQLAAAFTPNPLTAFIVAIIANFLLSFSASTLLLDFFQGWAPIWVFELLTIVSPFSHYNNFINGFIGLFAVLYLFGLVLVLMLITTLRIFPHRKWKIAALTAAAGLAVIVAFNPNWQRVGIDLSADQRHTLPATVEQYIEDYALPVTMKLYFSPKIGEVAPPYTAIHRRLLLRLRQYQKINSDNFKLDQVSVIPFSDSEDEALADGLRGIPYNEAGQQGYFGLAISSPNLEPVSLPFIDEQLERRFDYELLRLLAGLNPDGEQKTIGLLTTLPITDSAAVRAGGEPIAIEELQLRYRLQQVNNANELAELWPDLLIIAQPGEINPELAFVIEQYLLAKGKAIILQDPHVESDPGLAYGYPEVKATGARLYQLFEHWGLTLTDDKVVLDNQLAEIVTISSDGNYQSVPLPNWLKLVPELQNMDEQIITDTGTILLASAGSIEHQEVPGITTTWILRTSPQARIGDSSELEQPFDLEKLLTPAEQPEQFDIAVRLTGEQQQRRFDPVEAESSEAADDDEQSRMSQLLRAPLSASAIPLDVTVIADSDFIQDRFWIQKQQLFNRETVNPFYGNGFFILGIIETLMQDFNLTDLRTRQLANRPFVRLEEARRTAALELRQEESKLLRRIDELRGEILAVHDAQEGSEQSEPELQEQAIQEKNEAFRVELAETRQRLRNVQLELNRDINAIGRWIKLIHLILLPLLLLGLGLLWCWYRPRLINKRLEHLSI